MAFYSIGTRLLPLFIIGFSVLTCLPFTALANEKTKSSVKISFLPSTNEKDTQAIALIQQSQTIDIIRQLSQSIVQFTPPVKIIFGTEDGPLYDPELHQIHIPYSFWHHATERFTSSMPDRSHKTSQDTHLIQLSALDTLLHTLLHELGHAYIAVNSIPVLGKEEDAVDSFATIVLLNFVDNGDAIAISAADLFALEDEEIEHFENLDFIDEHSLDIQRFYYTLCLVYGSDPESHPQLLDDIEKQFKTEQEDICIEEFERVSTNWFTYLNEPRE
ncbi:DUF4344 domain-containing metallopeptidase [Photobacterium minamisatsumaniensis]|uniref:DUF4344 domain-containing metallopeptidase n=1 Tax=Photobacterium minamisatsumaniensis TaxID=2910233 RepID=UPI003D1122A4